MSKNPQENPLTCHHPHHPLGGEEDSSPAHGHAVADHDHATHSDHATHPDHAHDARNESHLTVPSPRADHSHSRAHTPDHSHSHLQRAHRPRQRRALLLCVLLTTAMMVVETVGGFLFGSLMLISDAIHMLSHAAALGVSLLAVWIANRPTSSRLSFGLYRVEILAAFVNGIGLAAFSLWIVYEGIHRILEPVAVQGPEMTAIAVAGLAVNLTTAFILGRAGLEDLNTRSAFLHMLADTFSSVAIVIGGVVISFTGWNLVDPILSIVVAGFVARWSWGLLRDSTLILLEARPNIVDTGALDRALRERFPDVRDVHDLHVWEITSQYVCLTAHLVIDDTSLRDTARLRTEICKFLRQEHAIAHAVLQFESPS